MFEKKVLGWKIPKLFFQSWLNTVLKTSECTQRSFGVLLIFKYSLDFLEGPSLPFYTYTLEPVDTNRDKIT